MEKETIFGLIYTMTSLVLIDNLALKVHWLIGITFIVILLLFAYTLFKKLFMKDGNE